MHRFGANEGDEAPTFLDYRKSSNVCQPLTIAAEAKLRLRCLTSLSGQMYCMISRYSPTSVGGERDRPA